MATSGQAARLTADIFNTLSSGRHGIFPMPQPTTGMPRGPIFAAHIHCAPYAALLGKPFRHAPHLLGQTPFNIGPETFPVLPMTHPISTKGRRSRTVRLSAVIATVSSESQTNDVCVTNHLKRAGKRKCLFPIVKHLQPKKMTHSAQNNTQSSVP